MLEGEKTYEELEAELAAHPAEVLNPMMEDEDEWKNEGTTSSNEMYAKTKKRSGARKRRKWEVTQKDLDVMEFLAHAKVGNSRQVAVATGSSEGMAKQRLAGLRSLGLVASEEVTGRRLVYYLTRSGLITFSKDGRVDEGTVG